MPHRGTHTEKEEQTDVQASSRSPGVFILPGNTHMNTDTHSNTCNRRRPFIKVCGQTYTGSVDCAAAYGADYIGFNFCAGNPNYVSPEHVAGMRSAHVKRVGVFSQQGAAEICRIMSAAGLHLAQLQGGQTREDAARIGPERIIRTLRVAPGSTLQTVQAEIDHWGTHCRAFLVESDNAALLQELIFPRPWILSDSVGEAKLQELLQHCRPDGVNLEHSVEKAPGIMFSRRLLNTMAAVAAPYCFSAA